MPLNWHNQRMNTFLKICSLAGVCFAFALHEGRHCGHMLGVHAPWRSSQWVYALRSCSVKVVSHGIIIECCETTFKVAITRKAYTPSSP
jgi:hypothetical protein